MGSCGKRKGLLILAKFLKPWVRLFTINGANKRKGELGGNGGSMKVGDLKLKMKETFP